MRRLASLFAFTLLAACSEDPITLGNDGSVASDADETRADAEVSADAPEGVDLPAPRDVEATDGPAEGIDVDPRDADARDASTACREPTVPGTAVCGAVCGNGVRDVCEVCPPGCTGSGGLRRPPPIDAGCCTVQEEACDQADLAGQDCTARGWSWGQLGCSNTCTFDEGTCASCERGLGTGCREGTLDGRDSTGFDLAATPAAVAVAWVTAGQTVSAGSAVHVAILAPDLTEIARHACFAEIGQQVAIIDDGAGWLLAIADAQGTRLVPLDASGLPSGPDRAIVGASFPKLAASTSGERALLYLARDGRLTFLDRGGGLRTSVRPFAGPPPTDASAISAAGNADRWFVAARIQTSEVATFDANLRPVQSIVLDGSNTEYPMISAAAGGAFVSYAEFSNGGEMRSAFLGDDGLLRTRPRTIGRVPDYFNPSPTLYDGATGHVLLAGYTGTTWTARNLSLARVTEAAGLGASAPVARAPIIRDMRVIAVGTEAVIGWRVAEEPGLGRVAIARTPLN